ncbi:MAG: acyl-CoA thioesterase [Candidatus Rokubacteria bacterium]|nr:acyl-CoA thioesterase [Candidatus Rokubacteria bacterium]
MGAAARLSLKVRHYEVDAYGHVNHANYVHYLETARIEALEAVGLSLAEMRRQGYLIVAVDLSVKYHAPARLGDTLDIVTYVRELRGARSAWAQEIREATSQRLVVTAEVTGAFMTESGRPVRLPAVFRDRLSPLHVPAARPTANDARTTSPPAPDPHSTDRAEADRPSGKTRPWCFCRGGVPRRALRRERRSGD